MSCNTLTGGILKNCANNLSGVKKIYIANMPAALAITQDSTGMITGLTNSAGTYYPFEFNKNTCSFTEKETGNQQTGTQVVNQTLTLVLARREQSKRNTIKLLAGFTPVSVIYEDFNNNFWLAGQENGMVMTEVDSESGTAVTDKSGYTLTFIGEEAELANTISAAAVAAVL